MESSTDLIILASPPRNQQHPHHPAPATAEYNEKAVPLVATMADKKRPAPLPNQHLPSQHSPAALASAQWTPYRESPPPISAYPASAGPSLSRPQHPHRNRGLSHSSYPPRNKVEAQGFCEVLRPWLPLIMYAVTSLAFVVAIAFYKTELFTYLDELSLWLRADEQYGQAVLFFLIFLTTIPPIPLYSTLIILSGYTFGAWTGAVISYFAALFGALAVFLVSRTFFRSSIERWLSSCGGIRRAVRAIERRPKLLFLVRLAPYPYNVMNCLLAASPTLTLHTYTVCTALSLFKVIVHTSVGAGIHSFRDYNSNSSDSASEAHEENWMGRLYTIGGIVLCFVLLVYLSVVARRAVDDELDDAPIAARDMEETRGFLSEQESDAEMGGYPSRIPGSSNRQMVEIETPYKGRR